MLEVGGGTGRREGMAGAWGDSVPGGHGEGGRCRLMGFTVSTWSRGLRRSLRVGERLPRGMIFCRTEGQKSSRVIARLWRVGWGGGITAALAVVQGRTGGAVVSGRQIGPASRGGEAGGDGEGDPCRCACALMLLMTVRCPGAADLPS